MKGLETYILKNDDLEVHVLNYGGIIDKLYCRDKLGKMGNVVLSYDNPHDYIDIPGPYLNALVGPTAGRIKDGCYATRKLSCNDGTNHLHGGFQGISHDFFEMQSLSPTSLQANLRKKHIDDGYQGEFEYQITYTLEKNTLNLTFDVYCTKDNPLYLTSHLYFNLSGDLERGIEDEILQASFKKMLYVDQTNAPTTIVPIPSGSCFDFQEGRLLRDVLSSAHEQFVFTKGLDHPFFVNGPIFLYDPQSGRRLCIQSDAPCVVLYSANFLDETMHFQNGISGYPGLGLAIELQDFPNGINLGLSKEKRHYQQHTAYCFDCDKS